MTMTFAIWSSAKQHFSTNHADQLSSNVDYANFAIIPVAAIINMTGVGYRVYDKISSIAEMLNNPVVTHSSDSVITQVFASTERDVGEYRRDTESIFFETLMTQIALATGLALIGRYTYDKINEPWPFIIETVFSILETTSYGGLLMS